MKKQYLKVNKTFAISITSIALISGLFIGVNKLVFATESNKIESITPITEEIEITTPEDILPEDYDEPALNVYEFGSEPSSAEDFDLNVYGIQEVNGDRKNSAISYEEAAHIGALYIWEIFDENIDGQIVEMYYEESPFTNRTYWTGFVSSSQEDMARGDHSFMFMVDAVSGEKKNAHMFRDPSFIEEEEQAKEPYLGDVEKCIEIAIEYEQKRKEYSREQYLADPDAYTAAAKEAAERHFVNTEITDVVYLEDRSNDGVVFMVTDETGHSIDISIILETMQIEFVDDRREEIDPSFVPDPNAVG